ncbi:Glutamate--tRNA ligase mitochondrial, partial [Linderina pennispora]
LFNYLLARRYGGQFILRIEDTDQKRFVAGATENILATLQWAGLAIDEGPGKGPDKYFQSQRTELYQKHAQLLLDSGHAYRCFCDSHRLELLRQEATVQGRAPMYDRRCLHLSQRQVDEKLRTGEPYTVRMKAPGALTEAGREVGRFSDIVHGQMEFRGPAGFDDAVLLKSDGLATYHLANVVDDHLMEITHVMRGEEWLISTPKHRALFRAFGWEPPAYAHLPLLMNSDGSKLSKRNQDGPVKNYISAGYLPQALVNYVALLGWHPDSTKEVFTMPELEQQFALRGLSRSKSAVSRDRLDWLQKQHLRAAIHDDQQVMGLAEQALAEIRGAEGAGREGLTSEAVVGALRLCGDRLARAGDLHTSAPYLFGDPDLKSEQARGFALK